eukprot:scaffold97347_cov23-Tisochrysis_lutea.AAC.2
MAGCRRRQLTRPRAPTARSEPPSPSRSGSEASEHPKRSPPTSEGAGTVSSPARIAPGWIVLQSSTESEAVSSSSSVREPAKAPVENPGAPTAREEGPIRARAAPNAAKGGRPNCTPSKWA